jgi:hypothetical protein
MYNGSKYTHFKLDFNGLISLDSLMAQKFTKDKTWQCRKQHDTPAVSQQGLLPATILL